MRISAEERFARIHMALVDAGPQRGCHWKTLRALGGSSWLKYLDELQAAGATLVRDKGDRKEAHGFWRVRMIADIPEPAAPAEPPVTDQLFDPPASPVSAIDPDLERVGEPSRLMNTATAGDPLAAAPRSALDPVDGDELPPLPGDAEALAALGLVELPPVSPRTAALIDLLDHAAGQVTVTYEAVTPMDFDACTLDLLRAGPIDRHVTDAGVVVEYATDDGTLVVLTGPPRTTGRAA